MSPATRSLLRTAAIVIGVGLIALLIYRYRMPRYRAGDAAADFSVTLANGQAARLSDFRGHVVLLQFWGSWCGPCRAENPHLVELYRRYHDRGFDIFSIGLEPNGATPWQRAIERDGLPWPHHAAEFDAFGTGPVSRLYNIKSIPATFLINRDGQIIGVNLTAEQMDRLLNQQLASR